MELWTGRLVENVRSADVWLKKLQSHFLSIRPAFEGVDIDLRQAEVGKA